MIAPTITRPALSPEHAARVERCLALLEKAQDLCNQAAQQLCPVPGFGDEWSALAGYDAVKGDWYLIAGRSDEMAANARRGLCPCCGMRPPEDAGGLLPDCCPRCRFRRS